jgi:hypothetical protein
LKVPHFCSSPPPPSPYLLLLLPTFLSISDPRDKNTAQLVITIYGLGIRKAFTHRYETILQATSHSPPNNSSTHQYSHSHPPSTALLSSLVNDDAMSPSASSDSPHATPPSMKYPSARPVAMHLPSRYIPIAAAVTCLSTIFGCVLSNRWHNHDVGGIPWPYISDTAKDPPQAGAFAFGMTVTACLVAVIVVLHYGKLKNDLSVLQNARGMRRNKVSLICGLIAAPNLALLACYDTARTPGDADNGCCCCCSWCR